MDTVFELNENKERFVFFLDIIGFSNLIKDNQDIKDNKNNILSIPLQTMFFAIRNAVKKCESENIRALIVSDSIIITCTEEAFQDTLELVTTIVGIFIASGLIVKGGLSFGKIHFEENYWGMPVIDAVDLEKNCNMPTIICDETTFENIKDKTAFSQCSNDMLKQNSSNAKALHYYDYFKPFILGYQNTTSALDLTIDCLEKGYKKATENKHKCKWQWAIDRVKQIIKNNADTLEKMIVDEPICSSVLEDEKSIEKYIEKINSIFGEK